MKHYMGLGDMTYANVEVDGTNIKVTEIDTAKYLLHNTDDAHTIVKMPRDESLIATMASHTIVEADDDIHFYDNEIDGIENFDMIDYYIEYPADIVMVTKPFHVSNHIELEKNIIKFNIHMNSIYSHASFRSDVRSIPCIDNGEFTVRLVISVSTHNQLGILRKIADILVKCNSLLR